MKRMAIFLWIAFILLCCGCSAEKEEAQISAPDGLSQSIEKETQFFAPDGPSQATEDQYSEDGNDREERETEGSEAESIQDEIAEIEAKSSEYENAGWDSMGQQEMNQLSAQWYQLWDDELNSLWRRLSEETDAKRKAEVLDEQQAWIKRKEENVRGAGMEAFGGSLQPLLENSTAEEMTRARAYILAGYLADVRNEAFTVPAEIQESIAAADPSLDDVFAKFEGQWIFDEERGACVGIERTEACAYGVDGSRWTVWITGGDIISDLDVYGYTGSRILFKVPHEEYDAFYDLSFDMTNSVVLAYGTSLDTMEDIIVCE